MKTAGDYQLVIILIGQHIAIFQEKSDSTQTEEQSTKKKSMKNDTQSPEKPKNLHGTGLSTYTQTL